jgi:type I restriction enzyme S subunit
MRTKNIQLSLDESDILAVPERFIKRNEQFLKEGDLLISSANSWELVGKTVRVSKLNYKATAGGFISILRPKREIIDPNYLYRFITHQETQHKIRHLGRQTTNISNLDRKRFLKLKIPLPSLPVQKKIAAMLEKADTLRSQCQQMEQELNSLAQSVFLDMFGDPTQTTLSKLKLRECLSKMESGWSPNCESFAAAAGRPGILKLGAVTSGVYLEKENKAMIDGSEPKKALEVKSGDLLFTRKNTFDLVAAVAYVRRTRSKLYIPDLIFRFVPIEDKPISKIYLWGLFSSVNFRKVVQSLATGAAGSMPNISKAKLLDLEIPFPPIELQEQYENRIVKIWELVATHEAKKKKVNEAFESVLQRAFKGELDLKDVA